MSREIIKSSYQNQETTPFESVEEAWFWFITAQQAKNDGARFVAGGGLVTRPCEPVDILKILDSLHRKRMVSVVWFKTWS